MLLLNLLSLNALPILILAGGWLPAAHHTVNHWPHPALDRIAAQRAFRRKVVEIGVLLHFRECRVLLVG